MVLIQKEVTVLLKVEAEVVEVVQVMKVEAEVAPHFLAGMLIQPLTMQTSSLSQVAVGEVTILAPVEVVPEGVMVLLVPVLVLMVIHLQ